MFEWIELFSSLNREALNTLEMFCQERQVSAWEILFNKWDESNSMYIVKTWKLEAYDENWILWSINLQEFVWEMSLLDEPKIRTASVRVLEDSDLIVLLWFSIEQLSKKHPEILVEIRKVINLRKEQNNWM